MKRVWVKKEHMYYKPFYKQKLKMTLVLVIIMAVVFFSYQIFCMNQLNRTISFFDKSYQEGGGGSGHGHVRNVTSHNGVHLKRFQSVADVMNKLDIENETFLCPIKSNLVLFCFLQKLFLIRTCLSNTWCSRKSTQPLLPLQCQLIQVHLNGR